MSMQGGPVNQANQSSVSVFGDGTMFGMDSAGWTVATGSSNTPAATPWGKIAIGVGVVAVAGFVLWKFKR